MPRSFIIFIIIILLFGVSWFWHAGYSITLESLHANRLWLEQAIQANYWRSLLIFALIYIGATAMSIPGGAILTLASGFFFGHVAGTLIVSVAATMGATLAFLLTRYLFGSILQHSFASKLKKINTSLSKNGLYYLLSLRLVPIIPFFLINILFGLTKMRARDFFLTSQLGMLPATIVYVHAGTELANLHNIRDIISWRLFLAFLLLALLPWFCKWGLKKLQKKLNKAKN